jgi:tetratricopeptide (TPR) repeat protein
MNTLYHARRFPEAVACAEELLRHDPQHLQAHILLAQILGGEGRADYARARAHAEHAVSLAPESDHAHYALGQVLASASGRWGARAALPRLQHAVRLGSSAQLALLAVLMLAVPLPSGVQVPPLVLVGLVVRVGAVLVTRSRTARYRRERRQERAQLWRTPVRDRARGA